MKFEEHIHCDDLSADYIIISRLYIIVKTICEKNHTHNELWGLK